MIEKAGSETNSDERLFLYVALTVSLVVGAGFCLLLFALNHRDQTPVAAYEKLPDSAPVVIQPDHPRQLVSFSLDDQSGRKVTRADLDGKFLVVSFLFTSCALTCPAVSRQMTAIQQFTTNQPDVRLVSLTVDPEDDSVPVLAKYGARFGADTNRWLFLTGDQAVIRNLIGTSFLSPDTNDAFAYMPGNFANIQRIAVVDPHGQVQAYFDGLNSNVATAVVDEINRLRK
jgi:cytochrome oxidase Cu insertion factor (SCO1/SenC/PrrC family)